MEMNGDVSVHVDYIRAGFKIYRLHVFSQNTNRIRQPYRVEWPIESFNHVGNMYSFVINMYINITFKQTGEILEELVRYKQKIYICSTLLLTQTGLKLRI